MRKPISILFVLFVSFVLSACAAAPEKKPVASQEVQRSHAQGAQDELSSEVHK